MSGGVLLAAFAAISFFHSPSLVDGHGYCKTPRSRNYYAHDIINKNECTTSNGCPPAEYCPHCNNRNTGVCGMSPSLNYETVNWLDKSGSPMPWRPQNEYVEGGTITINSFLDTHHNGHLEARVCVIDGSNPSSCTRPEHFAGKELVFDLDLALGGHPPMPKDLNFPERGMFAGGQGGPIKEFAFRYRLPMGVFGQKVLLQWKYITANSCSPPGYSAYFAENSNLPSSYWTQGLTTCTTPYPNDGTRGTTWPEQFFNCAEITIRASGPTTPTNPTPTPPTPTPPTPTPPTPTPPAPTPPTPTPPTPTPATSGYCNWGLLGTGASSTCDLIVQGGQWCNENQRQCETCGGKWCTNNGGGPPSPTPPPTPTPPTPTPPTSTPPTPTHSITGYCNWGLLGTGASSTCDLLVQGGQWCNENQRQCETCGGKWCTNNGGGPPSPTPAPTPTPPTPTPNETITIEPTTNEPTSSKPTTTKPTTRKPSSKPTTPKPRTTSKPTTRKPTSKPTTRKPM